MNSQDIPTQNIITVVKGELTVASPSTASSNSGS